MAEVPVKKEQSASRDREPQERSRETGVSTYPSWTSDWFGTSPFTLMRRFADEIDQFFGGFSPRRAEGEAVASWWPPMEVTQDDGKLTLCFDLPGMKSEDVKVEVTDDTLMVKGERKREREEKGKGFYRSERHYGSFARSIPLPQGAETDKVRAEFANGELKVSIPVPQATASRREIPIQSR